MAVDEPHGDGLAAAILDGTPIDWEAAEVSARPDERPLLRQLQLLAVVADVHRSPATLAFDLAGGAPQSGVLSRAHAPSQWGTLRVLERIGHGAFGEVYRAWDSRLDREVALKLLPAREADSRGTSIIEEGRLLARVRHPNVVTIHGAERLNGYVGLWMELIEGQTLQRLVEQGRRLPATEVARIGAELSDAVAAVHAVGLLHRDIKPSNVMLAEDGRIVLMDFGTGRELGDAAPGGLAGTPLFFAPELLAGGQASVRSDVYSIGIVVYNLLTGAYPLRASSLGELRAAHERGTRTLLTARRPDLPKRLARTIERAIQPDPLARHESAAALARSLRATIPLPLRTRLVRGAIAAALLAALVTPVAMGLFRKEHPVIRPSPRELTRLTFGPGLQTGVTWSPDSERIAYASDRAGNMDIWVQPVNGGEPTQMTSSPAPDTQPAWSPDGTSIVFRSERDGGGLYVASLVSGTTRQLTSFGHFPNWSPDSRTVWFRANEPGVGTGHQVLIVPVDGTEPPSPVFERFLESGAWQWLAPHPDGRLSAFGTHRTHGYAFFLADTAGNVTISRVPSELSRALGFDVPHPSVRFHWSPNGSTLYLEVVANALPSIWRVSAAGAVDWHTAERLTTGAARASIASVAPDGRRLAFTSERIVRRAWVYPFDPRLGALTGEGRPVTDEDVEIRDLRLSQDGWTLFYDVTVPGSRAPADMFSVDLATGDTRLILRDTGGIVSTDGQRMAYLRHRENAGGRVPTLEFALFVCDGGGAERLLKPWSSDSVFMPFEWTSDGTAVLGFYLSPPFAGTSALALWDASTTAREPARRLLASPNYHFWQSMYSPDSRWISFVFERRNEPGHAGMAIMPARGAAVGDWTQVAADHRWPDKPRWAPDGRAIYFLSHQTSSRFNVWGVRIDPETGRPSSDPFQVTHFDSPEFAIDPTMGARDMMDIKGDHLVLSIQTVTGNIWMLSDLEGAVPPQR